MLHLFKQSTKLNSNFWVCLTKCHFNKRAKGMPIFQVDVSACQKRYQFFNFAYQKAYHFFKYSSKEFFNFQIFQLYLTFNCKFQEYLGNSRNMVSPDKEFKCWHLQNFIKEIPYQPKALYVDFNGARGISQTII